MQFMTDKEIHKAAREYRQYMNPLYRFGYVIELLEHLRPGQDELDQVEIGRDNARRDIATRTARQWDIPDDLLPRLTKLLANAGFTFQIRK